MRIHFSAEKPCMLRLGGALLGSVGEAEKFADIAKTTQIIAVSHLAQIAAFADRQFLIEKKEEEGRTYSRIRALEEEERAGELVRLLGGEQGGSALMHAEELLKNARAYRSERAS